MNTTQKKLNVKKIKKTAILVFVILPLFSFGQNNLFLGDFSGESITSGQNNVFTGFYSGFSNTTGSNNIAMGFRSLYYNTAGKNNTTLGFKSLYSNITGNNNTASGKHSLYYNTTGNSNTASGTNSLYSNTTGNNNSASGINSLYSSTAGNNNTASGFKSLYSNTTGNNNTAFGSFSLEFNTTGKHNTAFGHSSGKDLSNGMANTISNNSIFIGGKTKALADNQSNQIVIGYDATGAGNNSVVLGNNNITKTVLKGNIGIGTDNPGSWELAVDGKIKTKEVKVTIEGWSDFVFYEDYQLPTLNEVENHIIEKGHLKDIPSAEEVKQDGFFLGEMDAKLLQKIEELTLYTIQQQKELEQEKKKNTNLEARLAKLEELILKK